MEDDDPGSLGARLDKWLASEGYPLEYYTAGIFRTAGFDAHQGGHVRSSDESPREIDVVADINMRWGDRLLRVSTVVECKWSKDKPWVVFTSPRAHMAPSACIAQTIGSELGDALVWLLSGQVDVHTLDVFRTPIEPGFGGRQAMTKGNDLFYTSMSAVVSASVALTVNADRPKRHPRPLPRYSLVCFPVIVIDGRLFEAAYDEAAGAMLTREVTESRVHWKGAASWPLHATVDIVTRAGLAIFAERRASAIHTLLKQMITAGKRLELAISEHDWSKLDLGEAPTGRGGLPRLLDNIFGNRN